MPLTVLLLFPTAFVTLINAHLFYYVHCVSKKNIPDVFNYNSRKH